MTETQSHKNSQMTLGVKGQNRYDDIRPFKHTSIWKEESDLYINANFVRSAFGRQIFIATQGPL